MQKEHIALAFSLVVLVVSSVILSKVRTEREDESLLEDTQTKYNMAIVGVVIGVIGTIGAGYMSSKNTKLAKRAVSMF
jgi:hypothetical protein